MPKSQNFDKSIDKASHWNNRLSIANDYFKKWEDRFKCKKMIDYFEGKQWINDPQGLAYVFNLVCSTLEQKIPNLMFGNPQFNLTPKPSKRAFNEESSIVAAQMAQDALNTLINQDCLDTNSHLEMAIKDSFFYFGIIEVFYDADWKMNPNAGKPVIASDYDSEAEPGEILTEPEKLPENENIYIKRIPAHRFRVGTNDSFLLEKCNWCGYYEWMRIADLKDPKFKFQNVDDLVVAQNHDDEFFTDDEEELIQKGDLVKVWKIWDTRAKEIIFLLTGPGTPRIIWTEKYERFTLFDLKHINRVKGWYPIPPVYNWKSPQDEQNESKEQLRTHRRRSKRVFQVVRGQVDEEELEKVITGPDGVVVYINSPQGEIKPVSPSPVDSSVGNAMAVSKIDFDILSGTTQQERGQANRATATEINTINARATIRETKERDSVATWLNKIGRAFLLEFIANCTNDVWIKCTASQLVWGADYQQSQEVWKQINPSWLEDFDFEVSIQVTSMSPVAQEDYFKDFMKFVSILQQNPILGLNPMLIREAAFACNFRNEQIIKGFMEAAQIQMIGQIEMGKRNLEQMMGGVSTEGPQQAVPGGNVMQRNAAQAVPPEIPAIQNEVNNMGNLQ